MKNCWKQGCEGCELCFSILSKTIKTEEKFLIVKDAAVVGNV